MKVSIDHLVTMFLVAFIAASCERPQMDKEFGETPVAPEPQNTPNDNAQQSTLDNPSSGDDLGFSQDSREDDPHAWMLESFADSSKSEGYLPSYMTAEEKTKVQNTRQPLALHTYNPPSGNVRVPAEYDPMEGAVVHFPVSDSRLYAFFRNMIKYITLSGSKVFLLQQNASEANAVINYLVEYGANDNYLVAYTMDTDAFWSRDFGPWSVYVNGERSIIDMKYYSTRPDDDYVPIALGDIWDEDVYTAPLYTEGGNFMTDGLGTCWTSTGIFDRNHLSESQARDIYRDYAGCQTMEFVDPLYGEGTTHIDMFSKILNHDTILISYSSAAMGANSRELQSLEDAVATYRNTPKPGGGSWNIVRIPMVFSGSGYNRVYNTYTNSLIMNNYVIVPTYGLSTDSQALEVYRQAMPGFTVVGVDSQNVIPLGGSVHCTTMQIPVDAEGSCGNGVLDNGEVCDGHSISCTSLSSDYIAGTANCNSSCSGWSTSTCVKEHAAEITKTMSGTIEKNDYAIVEDSFLQATDGAFNVVMTGNNDADLYVWKNVSEPTWNNYSCRPYQDGSNETCSLEGPGSFLVVVRGYASSSTYKVSVTYTPAD